MKYKFSQVTKKSVSLLLAILMMFSMLTIGIITTSAATDGVFAQDEIIYMDFSAIASRLDKKGINVGTNENSNDFNVPSWYYSSAPSTIIAISPKERDINLTKDASAVQLFKAECNSWGSVTNKNVESGYEWKTGNNLIIVAADGKSFRWGTATQLYFKNTVGWSNVYVHFYDDEYSPNESNGCSGQNATQNAGAMTKIDGTDIYSLALPSSTAYTKVCFTEIEQNDYEYFYVNNCSYSPELDFTSNNLCWVPDNAKSSDKNSCKYYNEGSWKQYPAQSTFTVTIDDNISNGNINITSSGTEYAENDTVSFKVTANDGYQISSVNVTKTDDTEVTLTTGDNGSYSFTMPASDVTINATFTKIKYKVTVGSTTGGSISGVSTDDEFEKDATVSFTVTADAGYQIDTVSYTPEGGSATTLTGTDGSYSFTMPAANVTINATFTKIKYKVTVGSLTGGSISGVSTDDEFEKDANVSFTVTADAGYQISSVSYTPENGSATNITGSGDTYSFTMPAANVTINATFTATSTPALSQLFFYQNTGGDNKDQRIFTPMESNNGKFKITTDFSTNTEFKLVSSNDKSTKVEDSADYSVSKRTGFSTSKVSFSESLNGASVTVDEWGNIVFNKGSSDATSFVVEYTPAGDTGLDGTIKIWTEAEYTGPAIKLEADDTNIMFNGTSVETTLTAKATGFPETPTSFNYSVTPSEGATIDGTGATATFTARKTGRYTVTATAGGVTSNAVEIIIVAPTLTAPKLKAPATVTPNSTVTVKLDNQKDFCEGGVLTGAIFAGLEFTYTVKDENNADVQFTMADSPKTEFQTAGIQDSITFTAGAEGKTYTVEVTASATGYNSASGTATVKVCTITYKVANRIYAYAGSTTDSIQSDAWVAAEKNAAPQAVYYNTEQSSGAGVAYPSLGATSETDLRIFLPTTASSSSVVLYNSFSSAITVGGTTVPANGTAVVPYTAGTSMNVTGAATKTLTIYKSSAQGALCLNNTDKYAGYTEDGVPNMITRLYEGKETGEIGKKLGNSGAIAVRDGNTVTNVAVNKIKGRGNSTWINTDKKSFNVTFGEAITAFGFTGKKFSLLANFKDPSLSRNKILYALGDYMGVKYSPDVATIDLYMNGLYMGNYIMSQKVEVGKGELISDSGVLNTPLDTSPADVDTSKGFSFLMELDSNASTEAGDFFTTVDSQKITIKEPEYLPDEDNPNYTEASSNKIKTFVNGKYTELINALDSGSKEDLEAIIDIPTLARYMMLNELAKNFDIGVSSTYFVYNNTEEKFYISPVWDMDVTTGNCDKSRNNYLSYEGNWTNDNSDLNYVMKKVFNNTYVKNEVKSFWTVDYYNKLVAKIDELTRGAINDGAGSFTNNNRKWTQPYGFQGKYDDNVQARTSLYKAEYSNGTYKVATIATSYETTTEGQTQYVGDWLKSRAAWLTQTYATAVTPVNSEWRIEYYDDTAAAGEKHKFIPPTSVASDGTVTWETNFDFGQFADNHQFRITKGYNWTSDDDAPTFCVSAYKATNGVDIKDYLIVSAAGVEIIEDWSSGTNGVSQYYDMGLNGIQQSKTYIVTYKPGTTNVLDGTITVADKPTTTITNPSVELTGDDIENEKINSGTPVALTANITPAKVNGEVVAGDYKLTLKCNGVSVKEEDVTITATDLTKEVKINTALTSTSDTFTVEVSTIVDGVTYTGTSNGKTYTQTGLKDKKIYFDPSEIWLSEITIDSTVTVTVTDSNSDTVSTFKMTIDPDDVHALAKGVFRAMVDGDTLTAMQSNTVTFTLDGSTSATAISTPNSDDTTSPSEVNADAKDGYIFTYDSKNGSKWCQYNVPVVPKYPGNCKDYQAFEAYLRDQADPTSTNPKDNIVYFDNSASEWYNVFIYDWNNYEGKDGKNAVMLDKLPYANIWYYDFGNTMPTTKFLFKDRSNNAYGTNYQQTVDLVGKLNGTSGEYVLNGNGEKDYLNFENTISTPNPIFVTANFYNCTQQGESNTDLEKKLKFRAFNTEWKEFSTLAKTKAVDVYFDMHNSDAADITLYHSSTDQDYKMATDFTRLTLMPGSNIYHAKITLPYKTDENGNNQIAFKFTQFIVNKAGTENDVTYQMSQYVQPKADCISTGEVWYEFGKKVTTVTGTDTIPSGSAKKLSSKNSVTSGANATILPSGYSMTSATIHFIKPESWTNVRLVIGRGDWRVSKKPSSVVGNVCTFSNIDFTNYDGFYFIDMEYETGGEDGDYWYWSNPSHGHVTNKIQDQAPGLTYRLVAGSSGLVEAVPGGTTTTVYVPVGFKYNNNDAKRFYVLDTNNNALIGDWTGTATNITDNKNKVFIGSTEYYRFDFICNTSTFSFKFTSDGGESGNATGVASGKTYVVTGFNNNNVPTYEQKEDTKTTVFYVPTTMKVVDKEVSHVYSYNKGDTTRYFGNWPGAELSTLLTGGKISKQTVNGVVYWVVSIQSVGETKINLIVSDGTNNKQSSGEEFDVGNIYTITGDISSNKDALNYTTGAPTPLYSVTLDSAVTGVTVTPNTSAAAGTTVTITPSNNSEKVTAVTSSPTVTITYNADGTATFKMPSSDVTISSVTLADKSTTVVDNCGILGYNHITGTFEATNGGTIGTSGVTLTKGYYTNDGYNTGYKTTEDGKVKVIYALVTEKSDATTSFYSSTAHTDSNYKFNGWTKDGNVIEDTTTLSDGASKNTATVSYVANWSEYEEITYTFVYKYDDYNVEKNGIVYKDKTDNDSEYYIEKEYKVKVNVKENASDEEIKALYQKYAPRLESDYFNYSFDGVTVNVEGLNATGKANISDIKKYRVTFKDSNGNTEKMDSYYQNVVELTHKAPDGKQTVWKNGDGVIIGYGDTYSFRITKNILISYEEVDPTTLTGRTFVNTPTYEFYTSGNTQRVRFNFLVENYPIDTSKVSEYGVLYFFTDENGKPVDTSIAEDANSISEDKLKSTALGASTGIRKYNATENGIVNKNQKFIFAPTLAYTPDNTDRYLRVYSYFITKEKDKDGNYTEKDIAVVSDASSCILGSIKYA